MPSKHFLLIFLFVITVYSVLSAHTGHRGYPLDAFVEAPQCSDHCRAKEYRKLQMEWCCWGSGHERVAICACESSGTSNCTTSCLKKKH